MWATSVIFKKLPKVNNRPMGENSPHLVDLFLRQSMKCKDKRSSLRVHKLEWLCCVLMSTS
jgi:hypothetical protein